MKIISSPCGCSRFCAEERGLSSAEKALLVAFGLAMILLIGALVGQGGRKAATDAEKTLRQEQGARAQLDNVAQPWQVRGSDIQEAGKIEQPRGLERFSSDFQTSQKEATTAAPSGGEPPRPRPAPDSPPPWMVNVRATEVVKAAEDLKDAWARNAQTQAYNGPSMHAPGFNVEAARARDQAAAMSSLLTRQGTIDAQMARILSAPGGDSEDKRLIAKALADGKHTPGPGWGYDPRRMPMALPRDPRDLDLLTLAFAGDDLRFAFARYAVENGTPEARAKAAQLLFEAHSNFHPNEAYERFGKKLQDELAKAYKSEGDSKFKRIARLLQAQELAKDPKWKSSVATDRLDDKLAELFKDPEVVKKLTEFHNETLAEVKRSDSYQRQIAMLQSEAFLLRLQLETPEQAKKTLELEIAKVAAIDTDEAKRLLSRLVAHQLLKDFHDLGEDERADAVGQAIDLHLAELAKNDPSLKEITKYGVKAPADVLKRIASVLKAQNSVLAANRSADAVGAIDKIVQDAAKAGQINGAQKTALEKAFKLIERTDKNGAVSAIAATAGLIGLGLDLRDGTAFKSFDKGASSVATLSKSIGSADSFAKLGAWVLGQKLADNSKWVAATRFGKFLRVAKFAGPLGDGITAIVEARSAYMNFQKGYTTEAVCDTGAAVCAVATTIAGIAIASGATGPAAPVVMLVGTIGYLGFKGAKWLFSEEDEVKLLREAGVYRDMSGAELRRIQDREIYKYANSCTSDRRNCPGPIGDRARELLDGPKPRYDLGDFTRPRNPLLDPRTPENMEARTIADRGVKFYKDHGASPGSCGTCH